MERASRYAIRPLCLLLIVLIAVGCGDQAPSQQSKDSTDPQSRNAPAGKTPAVTFEGDGFDEPFERIRIEAETGKIVQEGKLFRLVADAKASGGKCLDLPDGCGKPEKAIARVVYTFDVKKAGHYTFWCRRKWFDGCGDTLAVRFDKTAQPHKAADDFGSDDSSKPPRWGWSPVHLKDVKSKRQQYYLTEGKHTLEILNREDGPRYDVLLLTEDPDYVPMGLDE
ncbi:hypothetical protein HQ560_09740 [bacterium]|nr:hypothetical protein [bacterium]